VKCYFSQYNFFYEKILAQKKYQKIINL